MHGDLADLIPAADSGGDRRPDDVDEAELAAAAMDALVAMTEKYATLRCAHPAARRGTQPTGAGGLASTARAQGYRARSAVLRLADRSRLVNKALNRYLRSARRS